MINVMRMGKDILLKQVMLEVMELGTGRIQWRQALERSLSMYGWEGMRVEALRSLP